MLQVRWQVSYDLQLVQRRGRVYLQVMWAYLEQQSFPLGEEGYRAKLEELVGLLNGLGVAGQVACLGLVACLVGGAWVLRACLVGGASELDQLEARQARHQAPHQAHRDGQRNRRPPCWSRPCSAQL